MSKRITLQTLQSKENAHLQQGLQRAIAAALEKEAKLDGSWKDPNAPHELETKFTYIAHINICGQIKVISHTDIDVFNHAVIGIKINFPNVPMTFFVRSRTQ